jgi:hypothetical protein
MDNRFGLYPQFYVKRKDLLFPLIEKHYGKKIPNKTHGQMMRIYLTLLKSNPSFTEEVDALIQSQNYKNTILDVVGSFFSKREADASGDAAFYEAIATQQKDNDTQTLIIISVVSVAILGLGTLIVLKMRK